MTPLCCLKFFVAEVMKVMLMVNMRKNFLITTLFIGVSTLSNAGSFFSRLVQVVHDSINLELGDCPICQCKLHALDQDLVTGHGPFGCAHLFHGDCLMPDGHQATSRCPVCRATKSPHAVIVEQNELLNHYWSHFDTPVTIHPIMQTQIKSSLINSHGSCLDLSRTELTSQQLKIIIHAIPGNIKERLTILIMDHNDLTTLPREIQYLPHLHALYASHNRLADVPDEIQYLTKLKILNLSNNHIVKLPNTIQYLTHLWNLDLRNNQLTNLPITIHRLTQLKRISLSGNKLHVFNS